MTHRRGEAGRRGGGNVTRGSGCSDVATGQETPAATKMEREGASSLLRASSDTHFRLLASRTGRE